MSVYESLDATQVKLRENANAHRHGTNASEASTQRIFELNALCSLPEYLLGTRMVQIARLPLSTVEVERQGVQ